MHKIPRTLLITLLALLPIASHAAPIIVTATGTITDSNDNRDYFGLGIGNDTLLGATVSASWTFDSDDLLVDLYSSDPNRVRLVASPLYDQNSISSTVQVNTGSSILSYSPVDEVLGADFHQDHVAINDGSSGSAPDQYAIIDREVISSADKSAQHYLVVSTLASDFTNSLDPGQSINWSNPGDGSFFNFGEYRYRSVESGTLTSAVFKYNIETLTVSAAGVPEPGMYSLLALSMLGMMLQRRRSANIRARI